MTEKQFKLPIETENPLFGLYLYPEAKVIMEEQQDKAWTAQEIPVDKDISDYKNKMSPEQFNMVAVTLQLFVEIEQTVGEVWEKIGNWFPHSEISGACAEIARMEKSVHAFFYQKMSDELNIAPEEVAKNQDTIVVLKNKLEFLSNITSNLSANKPLSLATVAFIEQVLLFSNFAMLKSFQANGHNLIPNTVTGVEFVIQDETMHGNFAAYLFRNYISESNTAHEEQQAVLHDIHTLLNEVITHEDAVIEYTFGTQEQINDVTASQLKMFIRFRANETLALLGYSPLFEITDNTIKEWFYKGKVSIVQHDFFASGTSQYRRNWKFDNFSVLPFLNWSNNE